MNHGKPTISGEAKSQPLPRIEVGMPRILVEQLIGTPTDIISSTDHSPSAASRGTRPSPQSRHHAIYQFRGERYHLGFHQDKVYEVQLQPLNARPVDPRVIFALSRSHHFTYVPAALSPPKSAGLKNKPVAQLSSRRNLIRAAIAFMCVLVACWIPYIATAVQVIALIGVVIPVIFFGIFLTPVGWIFIGWQFLPVLLGGRADSTEPPPSIKAFFASWLYLIVTAFVTMVVSAILLAAAEPMGGLQRYMKANDAAETTGAP